MGEVARRSKVFESEEAAASHDPGAFEPGAIARVIDDVC
jgi:hypothetical protein